jgi:hypothetical protein
LAVALVLAGSPLAEVVPSAHHSISAIYDEERPVTLEVVVTRYQFINPHPVVMVDVKDSGGRQRRWRLELDNRYELSEIGFDASTLRAGDRLIVTGNPGRTIPHSLYVRRIERPADGFRYEHPPY